MTIAADVLAIAARHGVDTAQLAASFAMAEGFLARLRPQIVAEFPLATLPGVELLVSGSIAKYQCTRGSDLDVFGIVEAPLPPERTEPVLRRMFELATAAGFDAPFAEGSNGVFVTRAELEQPHVVTDDSRKRFRRMGLLTASVSAYRPELRVAVLRNMLGAFLGRERQPRTRGVIDYLVLTARLGNIASEWRMTTPPAPDGGWVNWAKCFTLYRVEYVAALVAILRAERLADGRPREVLIDALVDELAIPPLDRLARWYPELPAHGQAAVAALISINNDSLAIFARDGVRPRLAAAADDAATRADLAALEAQMRRVETAIVDLCFRDGPLQPWIYRLGLFG